MNGEMRDLTRGRRTTLVCVRMFRQYWDECRQVREINKGR